MSHASHSSICLPKEGSGETLEEGAENLALSDEWALLSWSLVHSSSFSYPKRGEEKTPNEAIENLAFLTMVVD